MVLMTTDHARDYAGLSGFPTDPMDLTVAGPGLFLMRWVTHFCAPVFALLMGASAWLSSRRRSPEELTRHLVVRGLVLLLLEFTLVDWGSSWNPLWPRKFFQVIGALGVGMIALGLASRLGQRACLVIGCAIVALHNLTDSVRFPADTVLHYIWSFVHQRNVLPFGGGFEVRTSYPFLPVVGVALMGYGMGSWIAAGDRRLKYLGAGLVALFLVLRLGTGYGDLHPLQVTGQWGHDVLAVLNVTKYPFSLIFVCITVGPALAYLGWLRNSPACLRWLATLGRVPMFYYVVHLRALHVLAILGALATGYSLTTADIVSRYGWKPVGFGFPAWVSIPFALGTVAVLFPVCRWYDAQRRDKRWAWSEFL